MFFFLFNFDSKIKVSLVYPITFLSLCLLIIMMTIYDKPFDSLLCLLILAAGIPVYYIGVKWKKPKEFQDKIGNTVIK
jgi:hypothetical protein